MYYTEKNKKYIKKIPCYYIFCFWLVLWTILYKLNITKINPYFLNLVALLFSILFFLSKKNLDYGFIILNIYLHLILVIYIDENMSYKNIKYNLLVFLIYLYVLYLNNTDMISVYIKIYNNLSKFEYGKFSLTKYILHIFKTFRFIIFI